MYKKNKIATTPNIFGTYRYSALHKANKAHNITDPYVNKVQLDLHNLNKGVVYFKLVLVCSCKELAL